MEKDAALREQVITEYRGEIEKYMKYIPWLQQKAGTQVSSIYSGENIGAHSVSFPVYDGTLMNFVREMSKSKLMDKNYHYVYTRNHIRTVQDEKKAIAKVTIREMYILNGILTKYVLGGMTKGTLWSTAVTEGIFLDVLLKMREVVEFWDKPLA
ncbi:MAG: hypothetical protein IJN54_07020 [Lachnospiraceae bacterium]|nr:hypothetical protein [Lachnospiraceae bacterium]